MGDNKIHIRHMHMCDDGSMVINNICDEYHHFSPIDEGGQIEMKRGDILLQCVYSPDHQSKYVHRVIRVWSMPDDHAFMECEYKGEQEELEKSFAPILEEMMAEAEKEYKQIKE